MSLTISQILEMDVMQGAEVIAGHGGLERRLTCATVLDAPDAYLWLQGDELSLTSTFPFVSRNNALSELVGNLIERDTAGLGVKLQRYVSTVPEPIIASANKASFPIIKIPDHIKWIEIITSIYAENARTRPQKTARPERSNSQLIKQLTASDTLEELMVQLYTIIGKPLFITSSIDSCSSFIPDDTAIDASMIKRLLYSESSPVDYLSYNPTIKKSHINNDLSIIYICIEEHSITEQQQNTYLAVLADDEFHDQSLIDSLILFKKLISINLSQSRAKAEEFNDNISKFISKVIDENISNHTKKLQIRHQEEAGNILCEKYFIIVLSPQYDDESTFRDVVSFFYSKRDSYHIFAYALDDRKILLLVPAINISNNTASDITSYIKHIILEILKHKTTPNFYAGISQPCNLVNAHHALDQAISALDHSRQSRNQCSISSYDETGVYRLLSHPIIQDDIVSFINDLLNPILLYDNNHGTRLIDTLRAFLNCNGNYKKTSDLMYVHPNTIRYRISQIADITGHKILSPQLQLEYQLALLLYDRNKQ